MVRATICACTDSENEVALLMIWLENWRNRLVYLSENQGCGCCVHIYDVEGPQEAIDALPPRAFVVE
jgi:hypothetical protein